MRNTIQDLARAYDRADRAHRAALGGDPTEIAKTRGIMANLETQIDQQLTVMLEAALKEDDQPGAAA